MGLFDDVKAQAQTAIGQLGSNVQDYIKSNVTAAFVKVAEPPKGNLTPAQIAAGQTGATPPVATPMSVAQNAASTMMPYLPIIAGIVVLALVLKKRR